MALYVFLWYVLALNRKLWNGKNLSRDRNPTLPAGQNAKQEDNTRTTDNQPHETNWGICRLLAALSTRTSLCFSCRLVQPRMIDTLLKLIHFYYLWAASQCRNPACFKHVMSTMWSRPGFSQTPGSASHPSGCFSGRALIHAQLGCDQSDVPAVQHQENRAIQARNSGGGSGGGEPVARGQGLEIWVECVWVCSLCCAWLWISSVPWGEG